MAKLTLALKGEYFDAIKAGTKVEEFRLVTPYWRQRIEDRAYGWIELTRGYPKREDTTRRLILPWQGFRIVTLTHPHFGPDPVEVFAINVQKPARPNADWCQAPEGTTHVMRSPGRERVCWIKIDGPADAYWRWPGAKNWRPSTNGPSTLLNNPSVEPRPANC
ncbi:ASCH domain-containing protein [Pseudomonas cichorii]|nr:ASCH domain-containing protein [Pseudomonas cichorii]